VAIEDKIVQKAAAETILTPISEVEFLGFSYGFRPGRGVHNALDALAVGHTRRKITWVVGHAGRHAAIYRFASGFPLLGSQLAAELESSEAAMEWAARANFCLRRER